jgi:hypothetical protein
VSFPLPPDTRAVGTGNPPGDMNQVVDALTGMNAPNWVKPSGDATGATDLALIQARINAATGPIRLGPGVFQISAALALASGTIIEGVSGGGFGGAFPPGVTEILLVNGANTSMITAADGVNHWRLKNLLLSANGSQQTGPAQTGTTGAAIHVADGASPAELQAEMDCVYVAGAFNDALYLGNNRRSLKATRCKFMASGTGNTVYGPGNGVTCGYSDHVFDSCVFGTNRHHGVWAVPANASNIRITKCDIFTNGQDWTAVTPTTVAAGSNGVLISGLTAAGVLNVAATAGFPATGSLWINLVSGPVVVTYTGTSGGNQFTGVVVQATQGNSGGTLATGQNVYTFGGNGVHIGSGCSGVAVVAGNSLDRNNGTGVFVETAVNDIHIVANRFQSNGQVATGVLPHIMLTNPNAQVSVVGNGMEPVAASATDQCNYFLYSNAAGSGWFDSANSVLTAQLSSAQYTNSPNGLAPKFNAVSVTGLAGATSGCRLVGAIASGTVPSSGTFLTGDVIIVLNGTILVCTAGGSPGTWVLVT